MGISYQAGLQTKQLILDVSKNLFFTKGYTNTTYSDISNAAGINRGLIPYHFTNKQSLGICVCNAILNQAYEMIKETLDTSSLSDDLSGALEIYSFYHLLNNHVFSKLLLSVMNDKNYSLFEISEETEVIKKLGNSFQKLNDSELEFISHVSLALKKEAVIIFSDDNQNPNPDSIAKFHIQTLMNYAGYKKNAIDELTDSSTQLANLLNYHIDDNFTVIISYK